VILFSIHSRRGLARGPRGWAAVTVLLACSSGVRALAEAAPPAGQVSELVVTGRAGDLTGAANAASQGEVSAADLALRPLLRPGEIVEQIPGVIVTQHSGSGKANQYFLRGFNLDHGTDLAVRLDGVPVNMPSHAHGQGYADLNFVIPELVERVAYEKGPYYADVGDFGSAGAFDLHYDERLPAGLLRVEGGQFGYARAVLADDAAVGDGALLYGAELEHDDGPWSQGDDARKLSGVLRYSAGGASDGWTLSAMAYHNRWNATDQIPDRALAGEGDPVGAPAPPAQDLISRWGALDPSDGGVTSRYALSAAWAEQGATTSRRLDLYAVYYDLDLFSNFTYFLDDPVHGDQIEQQDRRYVLGGEASQTWRGVLPRDSRLTAGVQVRADLIANGLYHTEARRRLSATSVDDVRETSLSAYVEAEVRWTPWFRSVAGLRADAFWMDVRNRIGGVSGDLAAQLLSPKLNLVFGPWAKTELYLDYGRGFHSNDARGVVAKVDAATALPRSTGAEVGLRTSLAPNLRSELSLWRLDLQSELVWDGDAGTNTPSGPTRRYGVELANWWTPTHWLTIDADYAWSHARFTDAEAAGPYVPEALVATVDGGVAAHDLDFAGRRWSAGLRLRYFGPRPLTQDGSVQSKATTLVYADAACRLNRRLTLGVAVFNLFDAAASDIDYYYVSRLPGEPPAGVADVHTHPSEPRSVRISLTAAL
jgi:hypothetical protein